MRLLKQSTARNLLVFMVDETDHVTGEESLTLTIEASKDGAAFASISPTVTERGDGWYSLALTTSHTDTLGDLAFHITATGADPLDFAVQVVSDLPGAEFTTVLADSVATAGSRPTIAQALLMLTRAWCTRRRANGTTLELYKEDLTTLSMELDMDSATNPTNVSRSS